tara:strand:+ start:3164 stop:3523 length:360 start_codon:yes stop_codon:yes gene_type:complete
MKVYIAGPMRGKEELNFPEFRRVSKVWRDYGYEVINPADNPNLGDQIKDRNKYLKHDIVTICGVDALVLLKDWEESPGARLEAHIAQQLDLPIYLAHDVVRSSAVKIRHFVHVSPMWKE